MKNLIKLIFVASLSILFYNFENNTQDAVETNQILTAEYSNVLVEQQSNNISTLVVDPCDGVAPYNGDPSSYSVGDLMFYKGMLFQRTATGWSYLGLCG